MWTFIKRFLAGVSKRVWDLFYPILTHEVAEFAAEIKPVIVEAITQAASRTDLDNKAKFEYVKSKVLDYLVNKKATYKESWVNIAIELAYQTIKIAKEEVKATTTDTQPTT